MPVGSLGGDVVVSVDPLVEGGAAITAPEKSIVASEANCALDNHIFMGYPKKYRVKKEKGGQKRNWRLVAGMNDK
jgi:hypothetical protein